ncbi:hypothetical protein GCM10011588_54040 [Nocardia jinanensis]|uniref:Uncharacterized protein n=1 Tax=Nocardia jinanensis TaxID=382504 RepID=A0A917RUK5_9NOCA|nr:hypothetical protein GCM10011588_54040 [Nocardia jinanensis]
MGPADWDAGGRARVPEEGFAPAEAGVAAVSGDELARGASAEEPIEVGGATGPDWTGGVAVAAEVVVVSAAEVSSVVAGAGFDVRGTSAGWVPASGVSPVVVWPGVVASPVVVVGPWSVRDGPGWSGVVD